MKPNQLAQVTQELAAINLGQFKIPKEIQVKGSNNHYYCIGVRSRDSKDGFSKDYYAKVLSCDVNQWRKMAKQVKDGVFKLVFADVYDRIVLLHNPTLPMHVEEPKKKELKGLSPIQKSKVNAMMEQGQGSDDEGLKAIGKELNISFDRLKAYLKTF
jgi:hypothetical protein